MKSNCLEVRRQPALGWGAPPAYWRPCRSTRRALRRGGGEGGPYMRGEGSPSGRGYLVDRAENNEIRSLKWKNVSKPLLWPEDQHVLKRSSIYSVKYREDGLVDYFKARLVSRGPEKIVVMEYDETFSLIFNLFLINQVTLSSK